MRTNRPTPTLDQFKQFSADIAPAARAVLMARVFAEMERERVNAYILPIFARYGFTYDLVEHGDRKGQPLEKPTHLYLSTDDIRVAEYFEECDRAHRAHGFTGPKGHCPALIAEHLVVTTEGALIDLAEPLFGIDSSQLFRTEQRTKYLELLIGSAIKAEAERSGR